MPSMSYPQCPRCKEEVNLDGLWSAVSTDRFGLMTGGPYGIACPSCGQRLRVHQGRVSLATIAMWLLVVVASVPFLQKLHDDQLAGAVFAVLAILLFLFSFRYARRLATLSPLEGYETVSFPLDAPAPDMDPDAVDQTGPQPFRPTPDEHPGAPWACRSCGESNPGEFDICWKCGKERPTAGA